MAAQNQHYVPKFILRQFVANGGGERVHVFDKREDRAFVTSIKNIMAERRFNDFVFNDDFIASFEPIACAAEDQVLPAYREVVAERRLSRKPEQKAALAILLAFQLLRTKAQRDQWLAMEEETIKVVEESGGRMQDLRGWEDWKPATENSLKHLHLTTTQSFIGEFAQVIAQKDFLLMEAAPGTSLYLGDNPVVRANSVDYELRGNLGLAQEGIEIYLPLSADLLLCAWCPSLLLDLRKDLESAKQDCRAGWLRQVRAGELSAADMKQRSDDFASRTRPSENLLRCAIEGVPAESIPANMDYYNSLQTGWAYRYIISRDGDFELARQAINQNPELRRGHRMKAA